jgi:predicted O-methyltransferase YrrM
MDLTVYPGSRIERLRRPLQVPALLLRGLVFRNGRPGFAYEGDGMATNHFGPFEHDPVFESAYGRASEFWDAPTRTNMRWRLWMLTRLARLARDVPGDYAEFGTYRGGCAYMILATAELAADRRLLLFDTFNGIPGKRLTPREAAAGFAGQWSEGASAEGVAQRLAPWAGQVDVRPGDVFATVPPHGVGALAFAHLDLNASAPTAHVLEHAFPLLAPGGILVFDDYGWDEYREQRAVIDAYFEQRPEDVVALPTGQGFVVAGRR